MNKKALTFVIIGLVGLPMAAAASTFENHNVVTGHTTYANMGGFDPDIAAIAGLAESKVVWFNGMTIISSLGQGYVYAVDAEAPCSPLDGFNYQFHDYNLTYVDPNNVSHIVAHYSYECLPGLPNSLLGGDNETVHVWVTPTHQRETDGPLVFQGNGDPNADRGRIYNFALAVDTSLMDTRSEEDTHHFGSGGQTGYEVESGDSYCEAEDDHVCNGGQVAGEDDPHDHNSAQVDLYFSQRDRGIGANSTAGSHPGTTAGCSADAYCNSVNGSTYSDPTSGSP